MKILLVPLSLGIIAGGVGCPSRPRPHEPTRITVMRPKARRRAAPKPPAARELKLLRQYRGRVRLGAAFRAGAPPRYLSVSFEVRDQKRYHSFVKAIPTEKIQMKQPAPASDDPLLERPVIDFNRFMLIVAQREHMYVGPVIQKVVAQGNRVTVHVLHPAIGANAMLAAQAGIGTYHAVVVPAVRGEVFFRVTKAPEKPPRR